MKTIIFSMLLLCSTGNLESQKPTLKSELSEKLVLDLSQVEMQRDIEYRVVVHFSICEKKIMIKAIGGTDAEVVELVRKKLSSIEVDANYEEDTIYGYRFFVEKR